jgi:predicted nicotinamide N-methyase
MTAPSSGDGSPPMLRGSDGREYPLNEFHLSLAGREWVLLHTGVILTHADESRFFRELLKDLPYGVALWPSAIALAHELAARGGEGFAGKTVLELGAGTGLPGIVAASQGARRVVQTDRQEMAMAVCRRNAERNGVHGIVHRLVDWTDWRDEARYDWILGSDILYGDGMHPHLRHIFRNNLGTDGRVLLADPFRGPSLRLLESLEQEGWAVAVTRWNLGGDGSDAPARPVGVFELRR